MVVGPATLAAVTKLPDNREAIRVNFDHPVVELIGDEDVAVSIEMAEAVSQRRRRAAKRNDADDKRNYERDFIATDRLFLRHCSANTVAPPDK